MTNGNSIIRPFSLYLKSQQVSKNTLRNYLIDASHFLNWLFANNPDLASEEPIIISQSISSSVLRNYKDFLKKSQISNSTINRRLSSLRKLSGFFISQGWRQNNPAKKVANINGKNKTDNYWQIVERFAKSLESEGKSSSTIRNYLSDIRGYLNFVKTGSA